MLDEARRRPSGKAVTWIVGDASRLGAPEVDLAIMSGHVVQFFLSDEDWSDALHALHDSLRPGGRLSFESRNPRAFEWETWTRDTRRILDDPRAGRLETWSEVHDMQDDIVSYTNHYAFLATGDELVSAGQLRFRTRPQLISSLAAAGFVVEQMYGDWDRTPAGPTSRELIVVAAR
jgi:SAM-dependent methyltransferase